MDTMEELYRAYLQSSEKVKRIGNDTLYRIIAKELLPEPVKKIEIVVPAEVCHGNNCEKAVDENGRCFHLTGPAMLSFHGEIPQWYRETVIYLVDDASNGNEIGDYIHFVP